MKRVMMLATLGVAVQAFLLGVVPAEESATQTKTGIVKNVDTSAKQVVLLVARELTFTVTGSTKIVQGDEDKKLADVQAGARVTVEYSHDGDTRTAEKIAILAGDVVDERELRRDDVLEGRPFLTGDGSEESQHRLQAVFDAAVPADSPLDGLVGYWPLDEGRGDRAANLMGENGNLFGSTGDAAAPGAAWMAGRSGGAIRFGKSGRGLSIQAMRELECSQSVTVAAWVNLDDTRQAGFVWNREQAYRLALDPQGERHLRFQLDLDGKWAGNWLLGRTALEPGRWYHVAGVYDGSERRVYVDGQLDGRAPATGAISGGSAMTIGQGFSGLIDEVRVWNRALTQEELARTMTENAGQVRATFRPEDALRFYPVKCIGMQDNAETAEVAVFNSAPVPFTAGVSVAVVSPAGKTLAVESQRLSITARGSVRVRLTFRPAEAGMHVLGIRTEARDLLRMPLYVLAPHRRQPPGELKLQRVASVDLTQNLRPDQFCEDGSSRVVNSPLGRYREAGVKKGSRFVARLTLHRPGLHLLRVRYPDDKARTCEVVACSPNEADLYNMQTGYLTGIAYPLSNRFQTLECLLWARDVRQAVLFTTWESDRPAAAVSVEAFEVVGRLPSSPAAGAPSARQIGLYWEDAAPLPWCAGAEGTGFEAFDRALCNLCDLMDYAGENVLFHPAVWYNGPIYNSLVEETGTLGGRDFPAAGWMDILLKRFEERHFKFYPTFNVHQLPSLIASGNADVEKVKAGEPTFNAVSRDGQLVPRTWHNRSPAYNAIHPQVKQRVLALVQELADRHGASPAFGGVAFHLTRCQLLQLGGLDAGYDDWTLSKFERETGVKVPVDAQDPERFAKRCDWLLANFREPWIHWRCEEVAAYYGQAAGILRSKRADLNLVAVVLHPLPAVHPDLRKQWEQGTRLTDLSREAGIDPSLIGRQPGVVVEKHLGPADYRYSLAAGRPGAEQNLLSVREMDFDDVQLRDYRTNGQFGVFLYNRYFESAAKGRDRLACDWYRDPAWLSPAIVPGGDHFMEYYAHAMAALDPTLIVTGGFTIGTVGHEAQVERFARVFRLLPAGAWADVPMPGSHVSGRTLQAGDKRYLYLVNRSAAEVQIVLPAGVAEGGMQPLGESPVLALTERGYTAKLRPYELAAWAAEAPGVPGTHTN